MRLLPLKPALTILTLLALLKAPDVIPAVKDYKVLDWRMIPTVIDFAPRPASSVPIEDELSRLRPDRNLASYEMHRIEGREDALDRFYEALRRTESREPGAVTRILHYGDSPATADMITGDARRLLQQRFGDAGHGFCLMGKPWAWYEHTGVQLESSGWTMEAASQSKLADGMFGLGGVVFQGQSGASTQIDLTEGEHTRLEVSFLRQPSGGAFTVEAEGKGIGTVDTAGPAVMADHTGFAIPPKARRFEIRVTTGTVRMFGVTFDNQAEGVSYDSLGLSGAHVTVLSRKFNEKHWSGELQWRRPDLVIVNYGTNESAYASFVDQSYAKELGEIVRRIRAAAPEASILLMSPMDRGHRDVGGDIATLPTIPRLATIQQRVALETGCGFFNTYLAMGGSGTMGRWYQAEPRLVGADFIHPMPAGARIVGNLLYQALLDGYKRFNARRAQESGVRSGE